MTVTHDDIIRVEIPPVSMNTVAAMSAAACIGGKSQIRGKDRKKNLKIDQLVGQVGQYAGSLWLFGSPDPYLQSRWVANQNPTTGDGGSDFIGSNIDFKASLVRNSSRDLLSYRLAVRPRERHDDWIYVLVLVTKLKKPNPVEACLIGWASDSMLPSHADTAGVFTGAFTLRAADLHPLPPLRWLWRTV
jgi:hypothetical protein